MVRKVPPIYYQMMMHCMSTDKYVFVKSYPKFGGETFLPIVDVELGESLVPVLVRDFGERNIDISVHKVIKLMNLRILSLILGLVMSCIILLLLT